MAVLSIQAPNELQTFTLFPKLPVELRLRIWAFALPGPTVVKILTEYFGIINIDYSQPILLEVNHESREVVLKSYTPLFRSLPKKELSGKAGLQPIPEYPIYFNPSIDTLSFRTNRISTTCAFHGVTEELKLVDNVQFVLEDGLAADLHQLPYALLRFRRLKTIGIDAFALAVGLSEDQIWGTMGLDAGLKGMIGNVWNIFIKMNKPVPKGLEVPEVTYYYGVE